MTLIGLASDNTAPMHPAVLDAIRDVNAGPAISYGEDPWTARAQQWFEQQFGEGTTAFLAWNGTGANTVALRAMSRPFQAIICAEQAHVNVDECGAPEWMTGCKLIALPSSDAKLTAAQIRSAVRLIGNEHAVQPRLISLTQTSEYGTAYSLEELREIGATARELGLRFHMDGARIANAAATLGLPVRAFTRDIGVDILSFGLTKNGGMGADAIVVFDDALAADMKFYRKQTAQLASKMRFLAAQVLGLAQDDLWLANAVHANAMARRMADGMRNIPGVTITQSVESNAVFAILPAEVTRALQERFHFYVWNELTDEVRLMASWNTTAADVDAFVGALRVAMQGVSRV